MNLQGIRNEVMKYRKAQHNLLCMIGFTVLNLFLLAIHANVYLLFSAAVPQYALEWGQAYSEYYGNNIYLIEGMAIACACVIFYFACWVLARRFRVFMLISLLFFALDSIFLIHLILCAGMEFVTSNLIDIIVHGWVLYCLLDGTLAWAKLKNIPPASWHAAMTAGTPGEEER